jgi:hypothetical protein
MAIKTAGKTFCDLKTESAATQTSKKNIGFTIRRKQKRLENYIKKH